MGYYVIFRRAYGGYKIYHSLVEEYRKYKERSDWATSLTKSTPIKLSGRDTRTKAEIEKYWKEREEQGLNASLKWICDAMERHGFNLKFLTKDYVIFQKKTWLQELKEMVGL